jgi:TonB family protein
MSEARPQGRQLRLAMVWNQAVLGEQLLEEPRPVVLGYGEGAVFPLPEAQAARGDVTLLTPSGDSYSLLLPPDARGALFLRGKRHEVRELLASSPSLTLGPDDYGVVSLGPASYFFQQVIPAPTPRRQLASLDGDTAMSFGLSLFVHVCVLLLMILAQKHFAEEETLELPTELISKFLVSPPPEDILTQMKKEAGDGLDNAGLRERDEGGGKKTEGDDGKVGKADARQKQTEIAGERRGEVVTKVRGMGLLGALSGGDTLKDALDIPSVGDMLSGLGSMKTELGQGSGGRGLRGVGSGGGGEGPGGLFGGGGLGTGIGSGSGSGGGRGAGGPGGRGTGSGSGRGEAKVSVQTGTPQVSGYLSAEQINRVVRANQAALRYCYESEVQRQKSLRGKVVIQWRVDRAGAVPSARVASSTLNDARVEGCLVRQVRKWRFPQPDGGEVSVLYPFIFGVGG